MSSSTSDLSKRWTPLQCPSCFGLFRVQREQLDQKGHCPVCSEIVSLPKSIESVKPHQAKDIAVADQQKTQSKAQGEVAPVSSSSSERRRIHSSSQRGGLDWEVARSANDKTGNGFFIGVAVILIFLVGAGGVYYIQNATKKSGGLRSTVVGGAEASRALKEALASTEVKEVATDAVVKSVLTYDQFDMQKVEEVVKGFLESKTVEQRLKYVRSPERVRAAMVDYYAGEEIEAEGFRTLNRTKVSVFEQLSMVSMPVQTSDFLLGLIDVFKFGDDQDAVYQVDWESWVGYCELSPREASEKKPTEPFLMRVNLRRNNYYNFGFSDDTKWRGFRMTFRNFDEVFLAYSEIGSEADQALQKILATRGVNESSFAVKVRFPPGARVNDQVEIVEVVNTGWITNYTNR